MLRQKIGGFQASALRPAKLYSLPASLRQPAVNPLPQGIGFSPRHFSEDSKHDRCGRVAFARRKQGFNALRMPVERNAMLLQHFGELVCYTGPTTQSGD